MPILQNIPVALTAHELVASRGQSRVRPALLRDAEEAISLGQTLWQPRAVYEWYDVLAVEGETVHLSSPAEPGTKATLRVGAKAGLVEGSSRALVGVSTIGPELEQRVRDLQETREGLTSYMLDTAGVLALGTVSEALRCLAEEEAAAHGWGVGAALSPGSLVGWSLRGQRELCALLPLDGIGVHLNDHCVLEPHKSSSVVIGVGPGHTSTKVGSVCKFCALQDTCWRRRENPS